MQLIIKNNIVIATHENNQDIADKYTDCEIILYNEPFDFIPDAKDPRTEEQKDLAYQDKRRVAYPKIQDQLDMIYHDKINDTAVWVDAITEIKERYPK